MCIRDRYRVAGQKFVVSLATANAIFVIGSYNKNTYKQFFITRILYICKFSVLDTSNRPLWKAHFDLPSVQTISTMYFL